MLTSTIAQAELEPGGVAVVRRAPVLNGYVDGSVHQLTAEPTTLNGGAHLTGDLKVPGTPEIRLNGQPEYVGTVDGTGAAQPANYRITLNGGARLQHVVRRSDPIVISAVAAPASPTGTRSVMINRKGDPVGDFATVRNLTLNGGAGELAIPPGVYGDLTINGASTVTLGRAEATEPDHYSFQRVLVNGGGRIAVQGPVELTLRRELMNNGEIGFEAEPHRLQINVSTGGVVLNGGAKLHAYVVAPEGTVTLNGNTHFNGGVQSERLILNGAARLRLLARTEQPPPSEDSDRDGMDDAWEASHGLAVGLDDAAGDPDGDDVTNVQEFRRGLNPNEPDSDGDDLYDGDELALGLDPAVSTPDTVPPSAPESVSIGEVQPDRVHLSWPAAEDNLRVAGYIVYRDEDPIDTEEPIRGTSYTDTEIAPGEEFTYQVRSFDYSGNLSDFSQEVHVSVPPEDTDADGLPDEWTAKYFDALTADPAEDTDRDGLTNLEEYQGGTDPQDFFNGVVPIIEPIDLAELTAPNQVAARVKKPDGTPWPGAPVDLSVKRGSRQIAPTPEGPFHYQLELRADEAGVARAYLEPIQP